MIVLAHGIPTYHCIKKEMFLLRAYLLTKIADMQSFKANQYLKGPNAFSPCRACRLQGCRDITYKIYYYPLQPPPGALMLDPMHVPLEWTPYDLPLRTHENYKQSLAYILAAPNKWERDCRAKTQGITGESILVDLPAFNRALCGPHDFMHLMYENIIPMLVEMWTGAITFPDDDNEEYWIPKKIWEMVGKETEISSKTIPAFFCRTLPDIASNQGLFIAESWSFWFQYLMPYLLEGRLPDNFYKHALSLVDII